MGEDKDLGDVLAGVVLLVLAGAGLWSLGANPDIAGVDYGADPGPGFLPRILLALLAAGALGLIAVGLLRRARRRTAAAGPDAPQWRRHAIPALFLAALVVYSKAMTGLGFLEATLVFSVLWTVVLGFQETKGGTAAFVLRRLALYLLEGAAITAGIYAVFAWLIKVPLP